MVNARYQITDAKNLINVFATMYAQNANIRTIHFYLINAQDALQ